MLLQNRILYFSYFGFGLKFDLAMFLTDFMRFSHMNTLC